MHSGRTIDSQKMSENEFLEKKVLDSEFTLRADHPQGGANLAAANLAAKR